MRMMNITSNRFDRRLLRVVCFAGAPVVLACLTLFAREVAADAGQVLSAVLGAAAVSIGLVVLGIVWSRPAAAE